MKNMTANRLRELLAYDPTTGLFLLIASRGGRVRAGDIAGYVRKDGYRYIRVDMQQYLAGRLAWLYMIGEWPEGQVDHKNGIRDDDRWGNLRDVTNAENTQNRRRANTNSKTGILGVSPFKEKFHATITLNGKKHHLGSFYTAQAAHAVYLDAKRRLHPASTL